MAGLAVALPCACASLPHPTVLDVQRAREQHALLVSLAELDHGRARYVAKCSSCHGLRLPESQPAATWPRRIDEMVRDEEVTLTHEDREALETYLVILATRPPAP